MKFFFRCFLLKSGAQSARPATPGDVRLGGKLSWAQLDSGASYNWSGMVENLDIGVQYYGCRGLTQVWWGRNPETLTQSLFAFPSLISWTLESNIVFQKILVIYLPGNF